MPARFTPPDRLCKVLVHRRHVIQRLYLFLDDYRIFPTLQVTTPHVLLAQAAPLIYLPKCRTVVRIKGLGRSLLPECSQFCIIDALGSCVIVVELNLRGGLLALIQLAKVFDLPVVELQAVVFFVLFLDTRVSAPRFLILL